MKGKTLQQHKETTLFCEEGIFEVEAISNLSIPQNSKIVLIQKPSIVPEKTRMYYTNCHRTNHNVETYRIKRKEDLVHVVSEITTQQLKVQRLVRYSCHICGDTRHKIIDCPK